MAKGGCVCCLAKCQATHRLVFPDLRSKFWLIFCVFFLYFYFLFLSLLHSWNMDCWASWAFHFFVSVSIFSVQFFHRYRKFWKFCFEDRWRLCWGWTFKSRHFLCIQWQYWLWYAYGNVWRKYCHSTVRWRIHCETSSYRSGL